MAAGWADRATGPAARDLGLDWAALEDQVAVELAVLVEVAAPARRGAAGAAAPACGIPVYLVVAVAREQVRVAPAEEVGLAAEAESAAEVAVLGTAVVQVEEAVLEGVAELAVEVA